MSFTSKILFYIITGLCTATAQILLSLYAKGISTPFCGTKWFFYSLSNPFLYGGVLFYGISFVMSIMLLRVLPVAQVTTSILAFLMIMVFIYNYMFGSELTLMQYLGGFMAAIGIIILNCKI